MVNVRRRHESACPHKRDKTQKKCSCPIWIDWRVGGKRIRRPLKLRDLAVATLRARDIEIDGLGAINAPITIQSATEKFEAEAVSRSLKEPTIRKYKYLFRQLHKFCESKGYIFLNQLTVDEVRTFRNSWTLGPRTSSKHLERLKSFFKFCVDSDWMESSPARSLKPPKIAELDAVPFSEQEVEKILKACDAYPGPSRPRLKTLTNLMLMSGLRIGDAVMIDREKILKNKHGYNLELRTAKSGTKVYCPLPDEVAEAILGFTSAHPFWTGESDAEDCAASWRKAYLRLFKLAGVEGHPHQFRHTFAKRLLLHHVPVGTVATILGHRKVEITERHYSSWIPERQQILDSAIRESWLQKN